MAAWVTDHEERGELWDAIQHMRRVQRAYDAAIARPAEQPSQGARISRRLALLTATPA